MTPDADNRVLLISGVGCPPPYEGNRARVETLIREMRALGYEVHFAGVQMGEAEQAATRRSVDKWVGNFVAAPPGGAIQRLGARVAGRLRRLSRRLLGRSGESVDCSFQDAWLAQARALQRRCRYRRVVVGYVFLSRFLAAFRDADVRGIDTHDSFAHRKERLAALGVDDYWHSFTADEQARGLRRANRLIAIQSAEADLFRRMPKAPAVYTVGHFLPEAADAPTSGLASNVGFVGSDNPVNSHALAWFLDRVWLTILDQTPNARLVAAGNICSVLPSYGSIVAHGPVDDLSPIYATCSFMLNPAQAGTGLKIKTVEALAFGRCVVTTPAGAEGVEDLAGKGLIVCTGPDAFAAAVTDLLRDPARAAALGELGRREIGKLNGLNRKALQALLSIPSRGGEEAGLDIAAARDTD